MVFPFSSSRTNTVILLIFLAVWTYTEITEEAARQKFKTEISEFIIEIEHDRLLKRVQELEAQAARPTECEDDGNGG